MSEPGIQPPTRKLDEFEELVFEYTSRMGLGSEQVSLSMPIPHAAAWNHFGSLFAI